MTYGLHKVKSCLENVLSPTGNTGTGVGRNPCPKHIMPNQKMAQCMILVCSKNVTEETDRLKVVKGYTQKQVLEAIYLHAATCLYLAQAYMTKPQNVIDIWDGRCLYNLGIGNWHQPDWSACQQNTAQSITCGGSCHVV